MIAAVLAALGLAALRLEQSEASVALFIALPLVPFAPLLVFLWPSPVKAVLAHPPRDIDDHILALEKALARSRLPRPVPEMNARYRLMKLYKARERYEDAVAQGRLAVRRARMTHASEAEVRLEIAVCLDLLGRTDEADAERALADETLDGRPNDGRGWLAQGRLLDRQDRYAEAAAAYQRALALTPTTNRDEREQILTRLLFATFEAGHPDQTVAWAEQLLASHPSRAGRCTAHRMAGVACASLQRLDEAERHRGRAVELARKEDDLRQLADCLAAVAGLQRLRGDLVTAEATARKAESIAPHASRDSLVVQAITLAAQGRIADALERIQQARYVGILPSASVERRVQARIQGWTALAKAELGRLDEARADLQAAETELRRDPKLGLLVDAVWVRLLALRDDRDAAVRCADDVLARLDAFPRHVETRLECLEALGRGLLEAGEYERAVRCWEQFLATTHPPVAAPVGWYYLGECRRLLNDTPGARECFERALAPGIDSHQARLARARLAELSTGPTQSPM